MEQIKPFESNGEVYLAVAFDSFGNEIVIDLKTGKISFRNHENGKIIEISDSLRDFIKICKSEPLNKASVKSVEQREKELIERGRGHIITDALRDMWRAEIEKFESMNLEEVII